MRAFRLALAITGLVVLPATRAEAYLDPGSGSMLLQLVLGGVAGLVVIVKLYWQKIRRLLGLGGTEKGGS